MKIKIESVVETIREMIENGEDEAFVKKCKEEKLFITANKRLIRHAKRPIRRAKAARTIASASAPVRAATSDEENTCEFDD